MSVPAFEKTPKYSPLKSDEDGGSSPSEAEVLQQELHHDEISRLYGPQARRIGIIIGVMWTISVLLGIAIFIALLVAVSRQPTTDSKGAWYEHKTSNIDHNIKGYGDKANGYSHGANNKINKGGSGGGGGYHKQNSHHLPTSSLAVSILKSPCGKNATEARAAGCHFDIISFAWLHPKCYDAELSNSFSEIHQWEWYLKQNRQHPIPASEALTGAYPVLYVEWEYHVRHCTYMWMKMHRAVLRERGLESIDWYIAPFKHTEHCSKMLLFRGKGFEFDALNTAIVVKYPDCGVALV
ncbi:hypothetical protein FQN57_002820 [Myotisia sp. PD_48]|nr:hypothetical protein FQN57_002820 [Myotisia sp. PD_48]